MSETPSAPDPTVQPSAPTGRWAGLDLDRRTFITVLAGVTLSYGLPACSRSSPPLADLVRALGLRDGEKTWLGQLSTSEQRQIHQALVSSKVTPSVVELTAKVVGPRSRLFAYVDYPAVADQRSVCDGLLQE